MDFKFCKPVTSLTIALTLFLPQGASGVFAQQIPLSLPGQILDYNKQPGNPGTNPEDTAPALPPQPTPTKVEDTFSPGPEIETTAPELKSVFIKSIHVEGVTLLDPKEVSKLTTPYENTEKKLQDIKGLADKLTALYRQKGYITSRVIVPPQTIKDGVITLQGTEGKVGHITIDGGKYFTARAVTNRINLEEGNPFRLEPLKASLQQINTNPDIVVKATLKSGTEAGKTDVELHVTDQFPVHLTPFYDNLGRRFIGTQRGGFTVTNNNFSGFGDKTSTSLNWSRRSFGVVNHYELPLGRTSRTRIGFDYAYSSLRLGKELLPLHIKGRATLYTPFISHDIFTSERYKVSVDLPFDFVNLRTNILGEEFSRDRLRVLRPAINFQEFDRTGTTYFRNEFGVGMNILGATTGHEASASRAGAGSKFFRWTAFLTRTQKLPLGTYGILRLISQLSPDRLVSNEQLQVGGAFTIRGYKEGRVIGDNGLIVSGEWRAPAVFFPKGLKIPMTGYELRKNVQMVSFTDFGGSWTNRPTPGIGKSEYLLGVGVGLRARLTRFLTGRVDIGTPLLRQAPDNCRPRLHFGLQSDIL